MADVLIADLAEYLAAVSQREFRYGALDCCTFMADWVIARGRDDPMQGRRGRYGSLQEYEAQMREEGGIVKSCLRRFRAIGLARAASPIAGDVCLVKVPVTRGGSDVAEGVTGSICVSDRFCAVISRDAGLVVAPMSVVCAWSVRGA